MILSTGTQLSTGILVLCVFGGSFGAGSSSDGLKFSDHYEVKGTMVVLQAPDIPTPFHAWFDLKRNVSRFDSFDGEVKTYQYPTLGDFGTSIEIVPGETPGNEQECWRHTGTETQKVLIQSVIPDVDGFNLVQEATVDGVRTAVWERNVTEYLVTRKQTLTVRYDKVGDSEEAVPVRYEMEATTEGSVVDHYIYNFDWVSYNEIDPSIFEVPTDLEGKCKENANVELDLALLNLDSSEDLAMLNLDQIEDLDMLNLDPSDDLL